MPNALPVPAMPASLRKERRWSAISQCPTRLLLGERSCKSRAQAKINTDYVYTRECAADPRGPRSRYARAGALARSLFLRRGEAPHAVAPEIFFLSSAEKPRPGVT